MANSDDTPLKIEVSELVERHSEQPSDNADQQFSAQGTLTTISIDDRYRVEEQIGVGGMGVVYKAQHLLLNRPMAVKVLNPEAVNSPKAITRFQQEAKAATALNHEHIASVKEFGITKDGMPYLAMDYVNGPSLADVLKHGPLDANRATNIFMQACEGMAHAHKRGILHRDLKPANILLAEEKDTTDFVKIVDFGIAKILPAVDQESIKLTQTGELFGTPQYMSPEQWNGSSADARTDIYSIGSVMYESLTGKPPFAGETIVSVIYSQLHETPKPFSKGIIGNKNMARGLENVVLRCLEKDPKLRFQTMEEVHDALKLVQLGGKPRPSNSQSTQRRSRLLLFAIASGILLPLILFSVIIFPSVKSYLYPPPWVNTLAEARQQMSISAWEPAEALLKRAIKQAEDGHASDIDKHAIYYQMGQDYLDSRRYSQAAAAFENAVKFSNPDPLETANTLEELAWSIRESHYHNGAQDQSKSAVEDYKRALELAKEALRLKETHAGINHPYVTYTLEKLGVIYQTLGNFDQAEAAFLRAIKIDESSTETIPRAERHWEQLAQCYKVQGKLDDARKCLQHAIEISKEIYGTDSEKVQGIESKLKSMTQ
jgi:serine/threonine protein kinase